MNVFSKNWFEKHQKTLLFFVNTWIGRWFFRIWGEGSSVGDNKIINITPNAITWQEEGKFSTEFRTHNKFGKRLFYGLKPLWYLFHAWDVLIANPVNPAWNLGFDSLVVYPDPNVEVSSFDGLIANTQLVGVAWADVRNATDGTAIDDSAAVIRARARNFTTSHEIHRAYTLFDTSALTADAVISAGVYSVYGSLLGAPALFNIRMVTTTPASDTAIDAGDFDQIGEVGQADDYPSTSFSTVAYNDMTMNATGRGNISLTGISKFGFREVEHDIGSVEAGAGLSYNAQVFSADRAGTDNDPKLTITYTLPTGAFRRLLLLGVG